MGERKEELYYEEDLERIRKVTSTGIYGVERKPFRPWRLLMIWWVVVSALGLVSYILGKQAGVI